MAKCRSCRAEIIWAVTVGGARIPVDAKPALKGNITLEKLEHSAVTFAYMWPPGNGTHVSHFVTCPQAGKWRS